MVAFLFAAMLMLQAPAPGPAPAPVPPPAPSPSAPPIPGPIIIETVRQPPITREITMGDVVLGSASLVGTVIVVAAAAGLLIGIVVVLIKRSRDRAAGPTDPGHSRLRS
jgi:hypothetical protein